MKRNSDLISIVVPCYNVGKCVSKCIISIKEQSYKNIEVILVDDGSTDNTKKIIEDIIKTDKRFSYYYKDNGGLSDARNFGMKKIKGKYVCFVDSDDYIEKDYVKNMYEAIIKTNSKIAICDIKRIHKNEVTYDKIDNEKVKLCIHPAAWNKMYESSLFFDNDIEFPKGKWYEDLATTPKLTMNYKYIVIKDALYDYVQNDESIMHTYDDRIFDIYDAVEGIEEFCKDKSKNIQEFINVYHILIGTIYRGSFHKEFGIKMIKNIFKYVKDKYPKWYKNKEIKKLPLIYIIYLLCIRLHFFFIVWLMLKLFNKKIHL